MAKIRFTAEVYNSPRTIFAARETRLGDLNIHVTGGGRHYASPSISELISVPEDAHFEHYQKHISIHNSDQSSSVNAIKQTLRFRDRSEHSHHVTFGLKRDNLFVPVLFRVCGDLGRDRYRLPDNCSDSIESLAHYDPSEGQLRFMIVISQIGRMFPRDMEHPTNLRSVQLGRFTITVLWSYLNQPSHPQAIDFFLSTLRETGPSRGLDWWEIYNLYTDINMVHAMEYLATLGER